MIPSIKLLELTFFHLSSLMTLLLKIIFYLYLVVFLDFILFNPGEPENSFLLGF